MLKYYNRAAYDLIRQIGRYTITKHNLTPTVVQRLQLRNIRLVTILIN